MKILCSGPVTPFVSSKCPRYLGEVGRIRDNDALDVRKRRDRGAGQLLASNIVPGGALATAHPPNRRCGCPTTSGSLGCVPVHIANDLILSRCPFGAASNGSCIDGERA